MCRIIKMKSCTIEFWLTQQLFGSFYCCDLYSYSLVRLISTTKHYLSIIYANVRNYIVYNTYCILSVFAIFYFCAMQMRRERFSRSCMEQRQNQLYGNRQILVRSKAVWYRESTLKSYYSEADLERAVKSMKESNYLVIFL